MKKYSVITTVNDNTLAFSYENDILVGIDKLNSGEDNLIKVNAIYTARVSNIVKNINAAFLNVMGETLFYDLNDKDSGVFLNRKNDKRPHMGDIMLVQVEREAVKSKSAAATSKLSIYGDNLILTYQKPGIGVSKKMPNEDRERIKGYFDTFDYTIDVEGIDVKPYGYVIRTNAKVADESEIIGEANALKDELSEILKRAATANANICLYTPDNEYMTLVNDISNAEEGYIITDVEEVYNELCGINDARNKGVDIRFHNDNSISLHALYDIGKHINEATAKNVWLKNGGYLVLEPTEALTVIDVNTGKSIEGKKAKEEHIFNTNVLAAREVARQLRLRNYSGIIIVDFIDMYDDEQKEELIKMLDKELRKDPVITRLVDITELGLVEITRKKIKKPLHEFVKK